MPCWKTIASLEMRFENMKILYRWQLIIITHRMQRGSVSVHPRRLHSARCSHWGLQPLKFMYTKEMEVRWRKRLWGWQWWDRLWWVPLLRGELSELILVSLKIIRLLTLTGRLNIFHSFFIVQSVPQVPEYPKVQILAQARNQVMTIELRFSRMIGYII